MKAGKGNGWLGGVLAVGVFGALLWLEHRRELRERKTEPKGRRVVRNLAVAGASAVAMQLAERPAIRPLARLVDRRGWGLLPRLGLPRALETALAVVLMDYTLYVWHILLHRVPLLWRCHAVHHVDLDMDASTALRFHFAELVASVPWRAAQVLAIGVRPGAYNAWASATVVSVMFHHSNVRLPLRLERGLSRILVTPRMHGIHHSIVPEETDSNYSSGLTVWDVLHGTLRLNVPQQAITIGVPAVREPEQARLGRVMAMPFRQEPDWWRLPGDGAPGREPLPLPADRLLP